MITSLPPARTIANDAEPMALVYERVELVARSSLPVLVTGETGAGKELVCRRLHARSDRRDQALVTINCAALPETLLESELFGFERGSFTGATQSKQGLIEAAHSGTLFLDEIGEMPQATQAKLLRVLEGGEIARIGSVRRKRVDVRVVAATNRDLPTLVARGEFRADLYFRLNGITITVPPLRERRHEIAPLAHHFLELAAERANVARPRLRPDVMPLLSTHSWPGNVRELRNVMERAVALSTTGVIGPEHIVVDRPLHEVAPASSPPPVSRTLSLRADADEERRRIKDALAQTGGNQWRAAQLLSMSRRSLTRRLDEYGIARPRKGPHR